MVKNETNYNYYCLSLLLFIPWTDLEWKIIYVGSASSESYDQVLDSVLVGPVPQGTHKFLFEVQNYKL